MFLKKFSKFLNSFKNASHGILFCIKSERNIRFHIFTSIFVLIFSTFFKFDKMIYLILFLIFSVVISFEMVNTAIEKFIDSKFVGYNRSAKIIKDILSGSVLVSSFFAFLSGCIIFLYDINKFLYIMVLILTSPILIILFLSIILLGIWFIFKYN